MKNFSKFHVCLLHFLALAIFKLDYLLNIHEHIQNTYHGTRDHGLHICPDLTKVRSPRYQRPTVTTEGTFPPQS